MKILWVTNVVVNEPSMFEDVSVSNFGGWIKSIKQYFIESNDFELYFLFPLKQVKKVIFDEQNKNIIVPSKRLSRHRNELREIIKMKDFEMIHLFGTELSHSVLVSEIGKSLGVKIVTSIQGIINSIADHVTIGVPESIIHGFTFRNLIKLDSLYFYQKSLYKRAVNEKKQIRNSDAVFGRTYYDYSYCLNLNPHLNYYLLNESLRPSFYIGEWSVSTCDKNTIFISQAHYSIKGFHIFLDALNIVKKTYPNAKVIIAGKSNYDNSLISRLKRTKYQQYILRKIRKFNLENCIEFIGMVDEERFKKQLLKCNVFVSPSLIENSPNSLSEAVILGVPSISSNVGGVSSIYSARYGILYPVLSYDILARRIIEIFDGKFDKSNLDILRQNARKIHDIENNIEKMILYYREVLDDAFEV